MAEKNFVTDKRQEKKSKESFGFTAILERIKGVKNIGLIVGIAVVSLIAVFVMGSFGENTNKNNTNASISNSDYLEIEDRLSKVLSKIEGVGDVSVMINFAGTAEIVTAITSNTSKDKTQDQDSSGSRVTERETENRSPVIIQKDGEDVPLILKENLPDVVGVVVVAQGAGRMEVRIKLLQAVQTLLDVSADKVEIFSMK